MVDQEEKNTGGLDALAQSKANVNITGVGKVPLQTAIGPELLKNLEAMIAERESAKTGVLSPILEGFKDASAWTSRDPSAALAQRDTEKRTQEESLFGMRNQLATLKQAQAQQGLAGKSLDYLTGGAGTQAPGAGTQAPNVRTQIPDIVLNQIAARKAAGDIAGAQAIYDNWAKSETSGQIKGKYEAAGNTPQAVFIPELGHTIDITPNEFQVYTNTGKLPARFSTLAPAKPVAAAPVSGATNQVAQAPTNYPVSGTFVRGVTPTHNGVDISTAENTPVRAVTSGVVRYNTKDTKGYGNAAEIVDEKTGRVLSRDAHLNKFLVSDGTRVNVGDVIGLSGGAKNAPGAGNSSGPHVHHENFTQLKSNISGTPTANAVVPRNKAEYELQQKTETELAKKRAEVLMQEESDIRKASGEERGKLDEKNRTTFLTTTDPGANSAQRSSARALESKVSQNPRVVGVFADPGFINAVGSTLKEGITVGKLGYVGVDLEDAYLKAFDKTYGKKDTVLRGEVKQLIANIQLEKSKILNGQGPVSDNERLLLARASGSVSDPGELLIKTSRALQSISNMRDDLRAAHDAKEYQSFAKFQSSPEYRDIIKRYERDMDNIHDSKIDLKNQSAAKTNPNVYSDPRKEASYQEYLKNRKAR